MWNEARAVRMEEVLLVVRGRFFQRKETECIEGREDV